MLQLRWLLTGTKKLSPNRTVCAILGKVKWTGTTPGFFKAWYKSYGKPPAKASLSIQEQDKSRVTVRLYYASADERAKKYVEKFRR